MELIFDIWELVKLGHILEWLINNYISKVWCSTNAVKFIFKTHTGLSLQPDKSELFSYEKCDLLFQRMTDVSATKTHLLHQFKGEH